MHTAVVFELLPARCGQYSYLNGLSISLSDANWLVCWNHACYAGYCSDRRPGKLCGNYRTVIITPPVGGVRGTLVNILANRREHNGSRSTSTPTSFNCYKYQRRFVYLGHSSDSYSIWGGHCYDVRWMMLPSTEREGQYSENISNTYLISTTFDTLPILINTSV